MGRKKALAVGRGQREHLYGGRACQDARPSSRRDPNHKRKADDPVKSGVRLERNRHRRRGEQEPKEMPYRSKSFLKRSLLGGAAAARICSSCCGSSKSLIGNEFFLKIKLDEGRLENRCCQRNRQLRSLSRCFFWPPTRCRTAMTSPTN